MLLAVLMMFSCFTFVASAAGTGEYYFTSASAKPGEEVTLELVNKTEVKLVTTLVEFDYDKTAMTVVNYTDKGAITGFLTPDSVEELKNFYWMNNTNPTDLVIPAGTTLATLTFKISEDAKPGEYKVTPNAPEGDTFDYNMDDVIITCTAGTITVESDEPVETVNDPYYSKVAAKLDSAGGIYGGGSEFGKCDGFGWDYTNKYAYVRTVPNPASGNNARGFYFNSYEIGTPEFPDEFWYVALVRTNIGGKKPSLAIYQGSGGEYAESATAVNADEWTRVVIKMTKKPGNPDTTFKHLAFRPFGTTGIGLTADEVTNAFFDVAAWGVFKDEYSANNYEFPTTIDGITVKWNDGETTLATTGTHPARTVTTIDIPHKENFTFKGWSLTADGDILTTEEIAAIKADTTLYAQWNTVGANTFAVKFLDWDDSEIASYNINENAMIDANIPEDPTRDRDEENWYVFKNWTLGGMAVTKDEIKLTPVTAEITFKADYTVTAHKNPLVWQPETTSFVNNKDAFKRERVTFKGYAANMYTPNEARTVNDPLAIEGAGNVPENKSALKGPKMFDPTIYKTILVRYYYAPGAATASRKFTFWNQSSNWQDSSLKAVPAQDVAMESGKWTYAKFDYTSYDLSAYDCNIPQFHVKPLTNIRADDWTDGEAVYFDKVEWYLNAPEVYTVEFRDNDENLLYTIDALNGETVIYGGADVSVPEGGEFLGWTTEKGTTNAVALKVTGNTVFYPVVTTGATDNVIYVSAQGNDNNSGKTPGLAVLTLKKAILLAAELAPNAEDTATVVVCGDGSVSGVLEELLVNTGMITVTSKYGADDYTGTARVRVLTGNPVGKTGSTVAFLTFENLVFEGLTSGNGWNFLNAQNNYFAFGEGLSYVLPEGTKQNQIRFRAGGESGAVDYNKFGGKPLIFSLPMSTHLGTKGAFTTNNIYAVFNDGFEGGVNVGNDTGTGKGTITGYTRIEVNGKGVTGLGMGTIEAHNADYAVIFNDGAKVVNPTVTAANDGNTYKKFVLSGGEGFVFHHNADVTKVGEFTVEKYPDGKKYYLYNGNEILPENWFGSMAFSFAESGTYTFDYADYKVTFAYGETAKTVYGKNGVAVAAPTDVTAPEHKKLKGWVKEGTEEIVDLAAITEDVTLVPSFEDIVYTIKFGDHEIKDTYGAAVLAPDAPEPPEGEEGKVFAGWKNVADETDIIAAGAAYTVKGDATYEATWSDGPVDDPAFNGTVVFADANPYVEENAVGKVIAAKDGVETGAETTDTAKKGTAVKNGVEVLWYKGEGQMEYDFGEVIDAGDQYYVTIRYSAKDENRAYYVAAGEYFGKLTAESCGDEGVYKYLTFKATLSPDNAKVIIRPSSDFDDSTVKVFDLAEVIVWRDGGTVKFGETTFKGILGTKITTPAAPAAEEGKKFIGWKNTVDNTIVAAETEYEITGSATYEAAWETLKFTVKFDETVMNDVEYGTSVTAPEYTGAVPGGMTFAGWKNMTDDSLVAAGTAIEVKSNLTFVSYFKGIEYDVVIDGSTTSYTGGSEITLPTAPETIPEGKKFLGWTTTDGGSVEYAGGAKYTVTGPVSFYPVYMAEDAAYYYGEATYTVHSGSYVVDLYVTGDAINVGAFGIKYPASLKLVNFAYGDKAEKFSLADYSVNDAANGIYADVYMPKNAMGGNYVIDAKAAPVKLGTFTFEVVDKDAFEAISGTDRFGNAVLTADFGDGKYYDAANNTTLYTAMDVTDPLAGGKNKPIAVQYVTENVIEKVVTVNGTYIASERLGAVDASMKKAELNIYDKATNALVKTLTLDEKIDNLTTAYSVELAPGEYEFVFSKTAYLTVKVDVTVADDVDEMTADTATALGGDIYDSAAAKKNEKVDLEDFVRILRGFDDNVSTSADYIKEADITEDGKVTIDDMAVIGRNYGKTGYENIR